MQKLHLFIQKYVNDLKRFGQQAGFTMIELLVVISVIGVLAVAVLSSINPIEQINKGRDTRTRSDAAQLINAVDRYYAIQEYYPWNYDPDGPNGLPTELYDNTQAGSDWTWLEELVNTSEVKEGFTDRIQRDDSLYVYKEGGNPNATMYVCFEPTSNAFIREAEEACEELSSTPSFEGVTVCPDDDSIPLICLP